MDPATLTAFANDHGYEQTFALWVAKLGEPGDLLIALSGSGKSPNILKAMEVAKWNGMDTFLVTQYLHGVNMQESEEAQLVLGHQVMKALREG